MDATEEDAPFFHRRSTHGWLRDLSEPGDWTIYAGLGVTIDRTGLSWGGLVDGLLGRFITDPAERTAVRDHYDPVERATILASYYDERSRALSSPDNAIAELREDLRRLLYGPRRLAMRGKLSQSIVEFALRTVLSGHSVILVTPNYDDYLFQDLIEAIGIVKALDSDAGAVIKGGVRVVREAEESRVAIDLEDRGIIECVYVHGFVGISKGDDSDKGVPVINERDYATFGSMSQKVLEQLFTDRNVLVVGSSLSDTPLVGALLATADTAFGYKRVALLPRGARLVGRTAGGGSWTDRRLAQMAVQPIYTDYHLQTAQFLHEVQKCIERSDGPEMVKAFSPRRYGSRLVHWWDEWFRQNCADTATQAGHHAVLVEALERIRREVGIPLGENVKLEVWVRWNPQSERTLALWASSVGTWVDLYTMRRDRIAPQSNYKSVQIFCNGAPTFLAEPTSSDSRWRTYFGTPIWRDDIDGRIPVGLVSLASMLPPPASSLSEDNLDHLDAAVVRMQDLGASLFST